MPTTKTTITIIITTNTIIKKRTYKRTYKHTSNESSFFPVTMNEEKKNLALLLPIENKVEIVPPHKKKVP